MTALRMSSADADAWYAARSIGDLGHLTADWLERGIESRPGYQPGWGPDDETKPLIEVLAASNRAGYATTCSQPGHEAVVAYNGRPWIQRAAVEGVVAAEAAASLVNSAYAAGLTVIHHLRPRRPFQSCGPWVPVTRYQTEHGCWHITTGFGTHLTRRDLRFEFNECHDEAHRALYAAHQVTLIGPSYGPDTTLWDVLETWAGNRS